MENAPRIFTGLEVSVNIDAKNRMRIIPDFRRKLKEGESLFLRKDRKAGNPILELKPSIRTDFANMTEEERIREYSAVELNLDKQNRIIIPENSLEYITNGREAPKSVVQTGGGDRFYIWYPEDFKEYERKSLENREEITNLPEKEPLSRIRSSHTPF